MPQQILVLVFLFVLSRTCKARDSNDDRCPPSSCGEIRNISHPFRLQTDPKNCGQHGFSLSCENNVTILYLLNGRYVVESINYNNGTIRISDPELRSDDCASLPRNSLSTYNFFYGVPYELEWTGPDPATHNKINLAKSVIFMSCENPVNSPLYIDAASCTKWKYSYALVNGSLSVADMPSSCRIELMALVSRSAIIDGANVSYADIHRALVDGLELAWDLAYWIPSSGSSKSPFLGNHLLKFVPEYETYLFSLHYIILHVSNYAIVLVLFRPMGLI